MIGSEHEFGPTPGAVCAVCGGVATGGLSLEGDAPCACPSSRALFLELPHTGGGGLSGAAAQWGAGGAPGRGDLSISSAGGGLDMSGGVSVGSMESTIGMDHTRMVLVQEDELDASLLATAVSAPPLLSHPCECAPASRKTTWHS